MKRWFFKMEQMTNEYLYGSEQWAVRTAYNELHNIRRDTNELTGEIVGHMMDALNDCDTLDEFAKWHDQTVTHTGGGSVGWLIYTSDCEKFIKTHFTDAMETAAEFAEQTGDNMTDILTDVNKWAWFTYEITANYVMDVLRNAVEYEF